MMQKMNETKHSMKMMWACVAFAALAVILLVGGVGSGALLFLIPCMLMMGMMVWMMMGGMGGNSNNK
jgi:choline-glycine betaine transporter